MMHFEFRHGSRYKGARTWHNNRLDILSDRFSSIFALSPICQLAGEAQSPIPASTLLQILVGIGQGLEYLHSRNFINSNVKPSNVLLTSKMEVQWNVLLTSHMEASQQSAIVLTYSWTAGCGCFTSLGSFPIKGR